MKKFTLILLMIILLVLVGGVFAMSSANFNLDWFVPLTGGGGITSSANYVAHTTVGQTAIGHAASSNYQAGLGYWSNLAAFLQQYEVYLPMILR